MNNIKFKKYKLSKRADIKNKIKFTKLRVAFFVDDFSQKNNFSNLSKSVAIALPVLFVSIFSYDFYNNEKENLNIFENNNKFSKEIEKENTENITEESIVVKKENIENKKVAKNNLEIEEKENAKKVQKDNSSEIKKINSQEKTNNTSDNIFVKKETKKLAIARTTEYSTTNSASSSKSSKSFADSSVASVPASSGLAPKVASADYQNTNSQSVEVKNKKVKKIENKNIDDILSLESISERRVLGGYYNSINDEFEKSKKI